MDGDHSATIDLGKARFRTSLATTPWREVGLQEICRIRGSGHHRGGCAARSANPVTFDYDMVKPALNSVDPVILRSLVQAMNGKHARRTAGLLRARVSSDSYDARRVRQLVRKQMLRFAASTPMGGVRAGGFAGLKRCG